VVNLFKRHLVSFCLLKVSSNFNSTALSSFVKASRLSIAPRRESWTVYQRQRCPDRQ
jgi:hypothetical protein